MMQIALLATLVLISFAVHETTANNPMIGNSARVAAASAGLDPKGRVGIGHHAGQNVLSNNGIVHPNTLIPNGMVVAPHSAVFQAPSTQNLIETLPQADLRDFHKKFYNDAEFLIRAFTTQFEKAVDSSFKNLINACAKATDPNDSKLRKKMSNSFSFLVYVYLMHNYGEKLLDNNVNSDLLKDNHFGCSGPFSYNLNTLGKKLTNKMQIVLALHHDAQRLDSERVKDQSSGFCNIAPKLIDHQMEATAIDALCAGENTQTNKCHGDCAEISVEPKKEGLESPIGQFEHTRLPMQNENEQFFSMENTGNGSAFMGLKPFSLSDHIKKRIAEIIKIINERKKTTPELPFAKELRFLPIAFDWMNYYHSQ